MATSRSTTVGGVGLRIVELHLGTAGVKTVLGGEEARIHVPGRQGRLTTPHRLNQIVVVLIEAPKNEVSELRVTKRLPDSGQGVGDRLDLVEVDVRRGVEPLAHPRSC